VLTCRIEKEPCRRSGYSCTQGTNVPLISESWLFAASPNQLPGRVSELGHTRGRLFAFVGFSDNRGLAVFVLLVVIFRLVVIVVIVWLTWVSRRHRIANEV
jgi:hypothetical protein